MYLNYLINYSMKRSYIFYRKPCFQFTDALCALHRPRFPRGRKHLTTRGKPKDTSVPARIGHRAACELGKSRVRDGSAWMGDQATPGGVWFASKLVRLLPELFCSST